MDLNYILVHKDKLLNIVVSGDNYLKYSYSVTEKKYFYKKLRQLVKKSRISFYHRSFTNENNILLVASDNMLVLIDDKIKYDHMNKLDNLFESKYRSKRKQHNYSEKYFPTSITFNYMCEVYKKVMCSDKIDITLLEELKNYFCSLNNNSLDEADTCITFEKRLIREGVCNGQKYY